MNDYTTTNERKVDDINYTAASHFIITIVAVHISYNINANKISNTPS